MDLSTFQLVDAINDMDMLRNLSGQQQQEQYSQSNHNSNNNNNGNNNNNNAYNQLHGDIDLLFQSDQLNASPHVNSYITSYKNNCTSTTGVSTQSNQIMSSPHYRSTPNIQRQNDCFDQEVYNNSSKKNNDNNSMY